MLLLFNQSANSSSAIAPTVDAGGPYVGELGIPTALDATVVVGTDPSPIFLWTIVSGGTGTFSDDSIEDPTFTPDQASGYVLLLTITPSDTSAVSDTAVMAATASGIYYRRRRAA